MKRLLIWLAICINLSAVSTAHSVEPDAAKRYARTSSEGKTAVATVNPYATALALDVVAKGGNAIDAALTAAFALGVVDGHNSGIGGGCFILVRLASGEIYAIDGREMAPSAAHPEMYVVNGKIDPELSRTGALAVGIPGSVAALHRLQQLGGKLTFRDTLLPAAQLAEEGVPVSPNVARRLAATAERLARFPAAANIFLDKDGKPWPAHHHLQQKDLARTYRRLAAEGPDYFYRGDFARQTAQWMNANGGLIRFADFANYKVHLREPVVSSFAGYTLYGFPPPSSGGTHVAQILNILEHFDLDALTLEDRYHLVAEAMKFAFADRAHWLGDPDFSSIPAGLTDKNYAQHIASRIDLEQVTKDITHGNPEVDVEALMNKHTTHIATADMEGNWVAITSTVNTSFGSKVVIPGTGVVLNNQMDDFSIQPGVANAFGLVGAEANSVQARKRPLSSMSPTLVLKDNQPIMTLGAAGGPTIVSQVLLTLLHTLHYQLPAEEALALPRIHQQWSPNRLYVESAMPENIQQALRQKGHDLQVWSSMGATQLIELRAGQLHPLTEPRVISFETGQ